MSDAKQREEKACDALILGALLPELKVAKLTDAELDALLAADYLTLPEDKAALLAKGNPFSKERRVAKAAATSHLVIEEVAMAMNRKNATDKQSEQARAEMERKRRELLG